MKMYIKAIEEWPVYIISTTEDAQSKHYNGIEIGYEGPFDIPDDLVEKFNEADRAWESVQDALSDIYDPDEADE